MNLKCKNNIHPFFRIHCIQYINQLLYLKLYAHPLIIYSIENVTSMHLFLHLQIYCYMYQFQIISQNLNYLERNQVGKLVILRYMCHLTSSGYMIKVQISVISLKDRYILRVTFKITPIYAWFLLIFQLFNLSELRDQVLFFSSNYFVRHLKAVVIVVDL